MTEKIKVTFLGTATSIGVPVIACDCDVCTSVDKKDKRFRASILIQIGEIAIVVDCGPDFRIQMIRENVQNLDAVIFTHEHRDHIAGLDDVRAFNYVLNKKIDIYGCDRVMEAVKIEFPYIFSETARYFGAPQLIVHKIENKAFTVNGINIIPIEVLHEKLPIFGFRIGDFTYITDASFISDQEKEKIKGSKVIVLNALRNSKHVSHFSVQEAVAILEELNPEKAYLTHVSHFIGKHEEVNKKLPDFIKLAYDSLVIEI
ncbi:MAG: MBL fold metallo-hydrolase [Bacteroidales bacterium]